MYGQLGLGDQQVADSMTRIDTSPEPQGLIRTTGVALRCGPFASYVFIKNSSIVWHWGLLPSTTTTSDRFVLQGVPVEFPMLDSSLEVTDIVVGVEHIVMLTVSGQVFTWGFGASGQLGLGHERTEIVSENAQPVDFLHSHKQLTIVAVASGWHHSLALASDQSVFAWGSNRLGACGATTKFHEYFAPIRVPIQLRAPIVNGDEQYTISCCGNTSVLTTRSRSSGLLTSAFIWGVCSKSVAVLTPVEVSDVRYQGRFAECEAGFGVLHWVYQANETPSEQGGPVGDQRLLQIQKANGSSGTDRVALADSGKLLAFDLEPDEVVDLRLTDLLGDKNAAPMRYSIDRLTIRKVQNSESNNSRELVKLVKPAKSEQVDALAIQLRDVGSGSAKTELLHDGDLMSGSPIEARVKQQLARERSRTAIARGPSQIETIEVCAVSVVNRSQQHSSRQPTLADLQWKPAAVKRVRICDDDTLVLLIEGITSRQIASTLRLEDQFGGEIQAEITQRGYAESTKATLTAIAVRGSQLGDFSLVLVSPDSETSPPSKRRLLEVVWVMNPAARSAIVKAGAPLIDKAAKASGCGQFDKMSTRTAFSAFVSTLLSNGRLRNAVGNTPFATTADVEAESDWDVDCQVASRRVLCTHQGDPFVLWRTEKLLPNDTTGETESLLDVDVDHREGHIDFWGVLPKWTLGDPAVVALSLTSAVDNSPVRDRDEAFTVWDDYSEDSHDAARAQALHMGLSVPQSPLEFLVNGNLVSNSSPISLQSSAIDELVTAWRDQHGELFYTSQPSSRAEYVIQVYGHESHQFRETAMGSRVSQWKTKLHRFLWELLDEQQCSIEDLFQRFLFESEAKSGHIQLRGFVSTLEGLGFTREASTAPSKQEWLTLFTEIQHITAEAAAPAHMTRSVFKTFLIDPFHQVFQPSLSRSIV